MINSLLLSDTKIAIYMKLKTVKNIIFDFGGVIYDIDFNLSNEAFKKLGIKNFKEVYTQFTASSLAENYEKGAISSDEFRKEIRNLAGKEIPDKEIDNAWNALLIGYRKERIDLLKKIRENYRIFLLSNTTDIHHKQFSKELKDKFNLRFEDLFEIPFFSHQLHMRKPDDDVFEFVLDNCQLNPRETLFIDDTHIHTDAAFAFGIQTIHLKVNEGKDIMDLFDDQGFLRHPAK
jgi:FMN phosphatase YigB (HAD superfamily)